ncbi:TetR/AcrR family transcriptional regulator C-terminal domain-containing protein [Streptosporangium carneum]|uniref:TetR family transcriptional regulator n=1 Tax=Streptosporangium carneum TaxID=47481 RepID=A0A9W6I7E6_9ACTN|nr:TetR/AcrR family transcriptional regulator C-terminal domain-containing protein [Streptosporangium carneum]GLK12563.1 TetR family transcriptional regulator [Streptosporangium carneum]
MGETRRPAVTRQTMIETALRLLDEVGLDGLTVRRLATELGVRSPALYWHIRTKQELLDGMADAIVLAAGMGPPLEGESWQDWLLRRARSYRASLLAHRDGARIVVSAHVLSPATVRLFDEELAALVGCGFTPVLALRTVAACTRYINGFVLQEQTERHGAPGALADLAALLERGMEAPLITGIAEGGNPLGEEAFEHGLRMLIDGTAATLT